MIIDRAGSPGVEDAAEAIVSADVKASDGARLRDRRGQCTQRAGIGKSLVRPVLAGELLEPAQRVRDWCGHTSWATVLRSRLAQGAELRVLDYRGLRSRPNRAGKARSPDRGR